MTKQILLIATALIANLAYAQSELIKIKFNKTLPLSRDGRVALQGPNPVYPGPRGQVMSLHGQALNPLKNGPQCHILSDLSRPLAKFEKDQVFTGVLLKINTERHGTFNSLYSVNLYDESLKTKVAMLLCNSSDPYSTQPREAAASQELTHESVNKILGGYATIEAAR